MIDALKLTAATVCFTLALAFSAFSMASDPVVNVTTPTAAQEVELNDGSFDIQFVQQCEDCNSGFIYGVDINMSQLEIISRTA